MSNFRIIVKHPGREFQRKALLHLKPMEIQQFGTRMDEGQCKRLYSGIAEILKTKKNATEFIGSHPVSLTAGNVHFLLDSDYLVCEKTDGIRVMLLAHDKIIYFYDRKNIFYRSRYAVASTDTFLFDGELYNEGSHHIFSIFDSLISKNVSLIGVPLLDRLKGALSFTSWLGKSPENLCVLNDSSLLKFRIITKQMAKSHGFCQILDAIPNLGHMNDGLIFTPVHEKYIVGARSRTLKWKPPHMNTVDFLIKETGYDRIFDLFCTVAGHQLSMGKAGADSRRDKINVKFSTFYHADPPGDINNKIGEFTYDNHVEVLDPSDYGIVRGGWSLYKIRTDKDSPNNIKVVIGLLESIRDNISEEDLRGYHKEIYEKYTARKLEAEKDIQAKL